MCFKKIKRCCGVLPKVTQISFEFLYSAWKLGKLSGPIATIFGGKHFSLDSETAKQAHNLAKKLVKEDISIITGGGPGIMAAASCGAIEGLKEINSKKIKSLGVAIKGIDEEPIMECYQDLIQLNNFCVRKWFLIHYSKLFIIFPGGIGTVDELFEVANLIKTKKIKPVPIILIGKEFWKPVLHWYKEHVVKQKLINEKFNDLFIITDDLDEAFNISVKNCKQSINT